MAAAHNIIKEHQDQQYYEVERQENLWGIQSHPDGTGSEEIKALAEQIKAAVDAADADGSITWAHIYLEEVAEALAETKAPALLEELDQCNAVVLSWQRDVHTR